MDDDQKEWLSKLTKAVALQEKLAERQQKKEALLSKLAGDRESQRGEIIGGTNLKVTRGRWRRKQKTLDYGSHDQTKEFDLDEQRDGFRLADKKGKKMEEWDPETGTQEQFQKHLESARIVDGMVLELEQEMVEKLDENGDPVKPQEMVPLFETEEIAAEVYDPLRRRGLMPETNVPDKYSRTKEMIDGSFEAYQERLKKEGPKSMFKENLGFATTIFTSSMTLANSGMKIDGAMTSSLSDLTLKWSPQENIQNMQQNLGLIPKDDGTMASSLEKAAQIFDFCAQGVDVVNEIGVDGASEIYEDVSERRQESREKKKEGIEKEDPEEDERVRRAVKIAGILVAGMSSALGAAFNDAGLGIAASAAYGALVKTAPLAKEMAKKTFEAANVTAIGDLLTKGAEELLQQFDPDNTESKTKFPAAIQKIKSTYASTLKPAEVIQAFGDAKYDQAIALFHAASSAAVRAAITKEVTKVFATDDDKRKARSSASKVMEAELEREEDPGPPAKIVAGHKPKDQHEADWMRLEGEWKCTICACGDKDARLFAGLIDRKIARLKRDTKILNWGAKLAAMPFDIASNFIAPLTIGGSAVKMMKNLYEAVKRTRDFLNFVDKQAGMFNAASAYSQPVDQFIHNSEMQLLHYTANAAAEAVKMIGAILQCVGGYAAAAGAGLQAGANAAQAIEAVLYEAKKRYDLERAWRTYKLALERPENRKFGLQAMKQNPTLAKYAVAWGAVIKKDQLVGDFLRVCDLSAEALKDPKANVHKVVAYLEARLPDDQTVVGRNVPGTSVSWAPAQIELTTASWISAKSRGETKAAVEPKDTRTIEAGLTELAANFEIWKAAAEKKPDSELDAADLETCTVLLAKLAGAMMSYAPMKTKKEGGGSHAEMDQLVGRFRALVQERAAIVKTWKAKPVP